MADIVTRPMTIEMYNFLSSMKTEGIGTVVNQGNIIDKTPTYISKMYTPSLNVSNATKKFLDNLGIISVIDSSLDMGTDSITYWLLNSNIKNTDYKVYNIFKATLADIYAYTYAIDDNIDYLRFINEKDLINTINNVTYLIDYLSVSLENSSVLNTLYDFSAALGVIKNNLEGLKRGDLNNA